MFVVYICSCGSILRFRKVVVLCGRLLKVPVRVIFSDNDFPRMNILIYDNMSEDPDLCAIVLERFWKLGQKNVFRCLPGTTGRYVWIKSSGSKAFQMHFCEVQVKGEAGKTVTTLCFTKLQWTD